METLIDNNHWIEVKDGDPRAVGLFREHYSCRNKKADHVRYGFSGQGESMVLLTVDCKALFVWVKQRDRMDGQVGVNCSVFRNEGELLSSELIKEACELAHGRWPNERLFTYVNSKKIKSSNAGFCFIKAGWRRLQETTKGGLIILEFNPVG